MHEAKRKKKKTPNKRELTKFSALNPGVNLKTRTDLLDFDYLHKLTYEELEWLNKFTSEYVHDTLDREDLSNNLHNTPALKKDCGDRNNARNRDILTRKKAMNDDSTLEDAMGKTIEDDNIIKFENLDTLKQLGYLNKKGNIVKK
jgi:hypothetical protein